MPRRAIGLSVALIGEFALLYPAVLMLYRLGNDPPPPPWLPALLLLAGGAAMLVLPHLLPDGLAAVAVTLCSGPIAALALPLGLHPTPVAGIALALAWWRGTRAASYGLRAEAAPGAVFRLAAAAAVLLLAQALLHVPGWSEAAALYLLLFFVAGLTTLAMTQAEEVRRRWQDSGEGAGPSLRPLRSVAGFLLVAALLTWLLTGADLAALGPPLRAVFGFLVDTALWLLVLVGWVLEPLLRLLARLLRRTAPPPDLDQPSGGVTLPPVHLPSWLLLVLTLLAVLGLLALAGAGAYRAARRRHRSAGRSVVWEERESTFTWGKLRRRRRAGAAAAALTDQRLGDDPVGRVRRLYRRLQSAGAATVRARGEAETPGEYRVALAGSPLPQAEVAVITGLYEAVRYGEATPDDAVLAAAEAGAL